ncbi:MAG: hypothetical protein JNK77_01865 [Saprospiraceae bacterium]|nr:hypothetical protein [Saprospiraceae bacterium]
MRLNVKNTLLLPALLSLATSAFSQQADSIKQVVNFKGAVSVTNNGFSFIPSFTLGDPAAIVNLSVGGKRFSFEPEFRYALEGKPWSFIFIWRYKLVNRNKFQLTLGTHLPALSFRTINVERNGETQEVVQSLRFFPVAELSPNYLIAKNVNVGIFYLYGRGAEKDITRNTHFLSLRGNFSDIPLSKKLYAKFTPQFFYLRSDEKDGFYVASGLALAVRNFPLSVSALMNKPLQTDLAGQDFEWNVSLIYSFNKNFVKL